MSGRGAGGQGFRGAPGGRQGMHPADLAFDDRRDGVPHHAVMPGVSRRAALTGALAALAGCGRRRLRDRADLHPGETPEIRALIDRYAAEYDVPPALIHRVVQRESGYDPLARNGPYYGLMQILPQTARMMGHRGPAEDLLRADVNLRYGVKYLRGAWMLSRGSYDTAVSWYAKGYYYEAKRRGLLVQTGLKPA